jgi:outer membrane protein assembly factor BamD
MGLVLLLAGCGGGSKLGLLEQGDRDYEQGDWPAAIEHYKAYLDGGTAGSESMAAQLRLARAYYANKDYPTAAVEFEIFQRDFPRSDSLAVAAYYEAMCWAAQSPRYDRDATITEKAIRKLEDFLIDHAGSVQEAGARRTLGELREKLARKDMEIAQLYMRLNRYEAARYYYEKVLSEHPESGYRPAALLGRLTALLKLGERDEAETTYAVLAAEKPGGAEATQARALLDGQRSP